MLRTLRFRNAEDAAHAGVKVTPYAARPTASLLYIAQAVKQEGNPIPASLQAELLERGIQPSSI